MDKLLVVLLCIDEIVAVTNYLMIINQSWRLYYLLLILIRFAVVDDL